jgi:BirA family transcriptional regulator, biotin operon repressor / biotin---[acetyl-CoA-carboxylase] ligase
VSAGPPAEPRYEGRTASQLAALLDLSVVEVFDEVASTQDVAHELGARGAPAGSLVLADAQTAGRGRGTRAWRSAPGAGIWMTLLERPADGAAVGVLSLRLALRVAPVLERWTDAPVEVKWPNDLLVRGRKLAGVLVEARWRGARPDWVAIGIGVNVHLPEGLDAAALRDVRDRVAVLEVLVPAIRAACAATGPLSAGELARYAERDAVRGRRCAAPEAGIAAGITADGALIIRGAEGERLVHSGSLVLEEQP